MKNQKIEEGTIKIDANQYFQLFKSNLDELMKKLNDKYLIKGLEKYLSNPSLLFEEIKKKCFNLLKDEYSIFSNIYSKINDVYNRIWNFFIKESIQLLFSQEKHRILCISYAYPEGNTKDKFCAIIDNSQNLICVTL